MFMESFECRGRPKHSTARITSLFLEPARESGQSSHRATRLVRRPGWTSQVGNWSRT